jgi:hypothetical protein
MAGWWGGGLVRGFEWTPWSLSLVEGGTASVFVMATAMLIRRECCNVPLGGYISNSTSGWDRVFCARAPNLRFVSGGGSVSCRSHSAKFWGFTLVWGSDNTSKYPSPSSFSLLFLPLFLGGGGRKFGKLGGCNSSKLGVGTKVDLECPPYTKLWARAANPPP